MEQSFFHDGESYHIKPNPLIFSANQWTGVYKKGTRHQRVNPSRPDPRQAEKINLNFYLHTSLWCLKKFYEGLKGIYST